LRFPLIKKGHRTEAPQHFQKKRNSVTPPIFFIKPSLVYPLTQLSIGQTYTPLKKGRMPTASEGLGVGSSIANIQNRHRISASQKKAVPLDVPLDAGHALGLPQVGWFIPLA
jgi:hypothetical protein